MKSFLHYLWCLFHPFKALEIRRNNQRLIAKLKVAGLKAAVELENDPNVPYDFNSALDYIRKRLQHDFFEVLEAHNKTISPTGQTQEESKDNG